MAEVVDRYFKCDMCGKRMDRPAAPSESRGKYVATFGADYAVAGHGISLKDLCQPCNDYVGRLMLDVEAIIRAAKEENALQSDKPEGDKR